MKHRMAVAGALAIGVLIAFLMVGRVRAVEPAAGWWTPGPAATLQDQPSRPMWPVGSETVEHWKDDLRLDIRRMPRTW